MLMETFKWNFPFSFPANMIFNSEIHFWCIFSFLQHLTPQSHRIWDKRYFFFNIDKKNVYKTEERRKIIFNNECHILFFIIFIWHLQGIYIGLETYIFSEFRWVGSLQNCRKKKHVKFLTKNVNVRW